MFCQFCYLYFVVFYIAFLIVFFIDIDNVYNTSKLKQQYRFNNVTIVILF